MLGSSDCHMVVHYPATDGQRRVMPVEVCPLQAGELASAQPAQPKAACQNDGDAGRKNCIDGRHTEVDSRGGWKGAERESQASPIERFLSLVKIAVTDVLGNRPHP